MKLSKWKWHPSLTQLSMLAFLFLLPTITVVLFFMRTWPVNSIHTQSQVGNTLSNNEVITGNAFFEKDSYQFGDVLSYIVRIVYRPEKITPDLNIISNNINYSPFLKLDEHESGQIIGDGIYEYKIEYKFLGIEIEPGKTYQLSPVILYYSVPDKSELQSYEVKPSSVYISSYYPQDVSGLSLLPIKGRIFDPTVSRQFFTGLNTIILLSLVLILSKFYLLRRTGNDLSTPERLWREFYEVNNIKMSTRLYLTKCEKVFLEILKYKLNIYPDEFWSGRSLEDSFLKEYVARAHKIFKSAYQEVPPENKDASDVKEIINIILSKDVEEERLISEQQSSLLTRLKGQRLIIIFICAFTLLSIIYAYMTIYPEKWLSPEFKQYEQALNQLVNSSDMSREREPHTDFLTLGNLATNNKIKAASFYNAGTLLALNTQRIDKNLAESLEKLLGSEELFKSLYRIQASLQEAKNMLIEALRIDREDYSIRRNLELVIKFRKIVITEIARLIESGVLNIEETLLEELNNTLLSSIGIEFVISEDEKNKKQRDEQEELF